MNNSEWTNNEDEQLVKLIEPNKYLYNILDCSRKNILDREATWQKIAQQLSKPVEECKIRWRGLKDTYTRSKKLGLKCNLQKDVYEHLKFLDSFDISNEDENEIVIEGDMTEENVITDKQEYYEITLAPTGNPAQVLNIIPGISKRFPKKRIIKQDILNKGVPKKRGPKPGPRKQIVPVPNIPVKILPKPILLENSNVIEYVKPQISAPEPPAPKNSTTIDKLIEKILKENTNEIDVFFRSMAVSVKKLQPHLIPKVKMEVCNVIAKYEMQSFTNMQNGCNF